MKQFKLLYQTFFYSFIFLSCFCCKAQVPPALNKDTSKYFNIDKYKDWEVDTDYTYTQFNKHFIKGNLKASIYYSRTNIRTKDDSIDIYKLKEISEFISIMNSPYKFGRFYYPNGNLKIQLQFFYDFKIGIEKNCDEQGKLVEEINYDKPYKFTLDRLITKMKRKYDLDLLDGKSLSVHRGISKKGTIEKYPYYNIWVRLKPSTPEFGYTDYLIDGITGKTLLVKEQSEEMGYESSIWEFYTNQLEKRKNSSSPIYKTYKGREFTREEWEQFTADDFYSYNLPPDTLEYFTLDKYKDWQINYRGVINTQFDKFLKKDNRRAQITYRYKNNPYSDRDSVDLSKLELEEIVEGTSKINSSFMTIRYYYPNGSLRTKLYKFYYNTIGKERSYDEQGKLVKEIDHDEPYKFTLNQLVAKMKQEYHIDPLNEDPLGYTHIDVNRSLSKKGTREEYPIYKVWVRKKLKTPNQEYDKTEYTTYLIDGITGETLSIEKE